MWFLKLKILLIRDDAKGNISKTATSSLDCFQKRFSSTQNQEIVSKHNFNSSKPVSGAIHGVLDLGGGRH